MKFLSNTNINKKLFISEKLGIGISDPVYPLDVSGDINITGKFRINSVEFEGGGAVASVNGKTGVVTLTASDVGAAATSHTHGSITTDGKIGSTANLVIQTGTGGALTAKAAGTTSQYLRGDGTWATPPDNQGVTSVTGTSPIASSGGTTPAISLAANYGDTQNPYASKTAKYVLAAPNATNGSPTFRLLVASDIPNLDTSKLTAGTLGVARGGTGATTFTSGNVLIGNGTSAVTTLSRSGIDSRTSFPPSSHSTTLLTSGTLGIVRGGTGRTDGYAVGVVETRASVLTKIWTGTQAQYDAIGTKDANTLYFII